MKKRKNKKTEITEDIKNSAAKKAQTKTAKKIN